MSGFIIVMALGMLGLLLMAIPGLSRHGHAGHSSAHGMFHHAHTASHLGHGAHTTHGSPATTHNNAGPAAAKSAPGQQGNIASADSGIAYLRWIPSPRIVFSLMTIWGGFGYALEESAHLNRLLASLLAIIPAVAIEKLVVAPLWNMITAFEGIPSSPLTELTFQEAEAVTQFRNGKGIVTVVRDGRAVQFRATLPESQTGVPVKVGDKLRIEQVDEKLERVTVSIS